MTPDDLEAFTAELTLTAELFAAPLSEARISAYFEALRDQSLADVALGFHLARQTARFFPMPADVRQHIRGPIEARAAEAFTSVWKTYVLPMSGEYRGARPALPLTGLTGLTVQAMGGPSTFTDAPAGSGGRLYAQFVRLYAVLAAKSERQRALTAYESHLPQLENRVAALPTEDLTHA